MHRPKYDDWSWAKGKLDPGEDAPRGRGARDPRGDRARRAPRAAAAGGGVHRARRDRRPGHQAGALLVGPGDRRRRARSSNEIDEVAWLDVRTAHDRLDYARDRDQLLRARPGRQQPDGCAPGRSRSSATPRPSPAASGRGDDRRRPLDAVGRAQATSRLAVLAAYGVTRVVTSPSTRCAAHRQPYAAARRAARCAPATALSEEGFAADADEGATATCGACSSAATPPPLCSHGPVLPTLLGDLHDPVAPPAERGGDRGRATCALPRTRRCARARCSSATSSGSGEDARVVDVERIDT